MEHQSITARSTGLFQAVNDAADYLHLAAEVCARDISVKSRGHSRNCDLIALFGITLGLSFAASCTTLLIYRGVLVI
jgi:hypothetical protein